MKSYFSFDWFRLILSGSGWFGWIGPSVWHFIDVTCPHELSVGSAELPDGLRARGVETFIDVFFRESVRSSRSNWGGLFLFIERLQRIHERYCGDRLLQRFFNISVVALRWSTWQRKNSISIYIRCSRFVDYQLVENLKPFKLISKPYHTQSISNTTSRHQLDKMDDFSLMKSILTLNWSGLIGLKWVVPWLFSADIISTLDSSLSMTIDSQELVSPRPMTCVVGVGVDGGVNEVSDESDARASRRFFRGVTWSSTSLLLEFIDSKLFDVGDSVSVSSLMACLSHRFLADPPALPGRGAAHKFSSSVWLASWGSGDLDPPEGHLNEAKLEGL